MDQTFNQVQMSTPPHSTFNLSHDWKGSLKMGKLVPVLTQEALPSDRFSIQADAMFRMMPMIAPIMHKVDIFFHGFFVPNRILWSNWEKFITAGQIGDIPPALPVFTPEIGVGVDASSLRNYLGLPVYTGTFPLDVSALPFAAYHRIWYDWYRDQNLQNVPEIQLKDGDNAVSLGGHQDELEILRDRAWEHDYFTSALPFIQKGTAVGMPVDFSGAQILAVSPTQTATGFNPVVRSNNNQPPFVDGQAMAGSVNSRNNTNNVGSYGLENTTPTFFGGYYDPLGTLVVDGQVTATINDLRAAQALQKWLEKNARGGSRYKEALLVHFGVRSSDGRLDRAEYLGGSKATLAISEVLQTSSTDATTPQGNMSGHGISVSGGPIVNYQCEEHGWFMVIMSIRPKTAYYQGVPRWFLKRDRLDYYFSEFAHLGEQEVFNAELVVTGTDDMEPFGYNPRFAEYRTIPSRVVGQMATTLEYWHLGRKFSVAAPVPLNDDFIICEPDKRIFAVVAPTDDEIIGHIIFKVFARRPLPMYGTPI